MQENIELFKMEKWKHTQFWPAVEFLEILNYNLSIAIVYLGSSLFLMLFFFQSFSAGPCRGNVYKRTSTLKLAHSIKL